MKKRTDTTEARKRLDSLVADHRLDGEPYLARFAARALAIRPELGYQCTELGGQTAAFKDLDEPPDPVVVAFRFDGDSLVLEEGEGVKVLERVR